MTSETWALNDPQTRIDYGKFLAARELGMKPPMGYRDRFSARFYTRMDRFHLAEAEPKKTKLKFGGIFNLEFNLDGRLLVAACEKKGVLIYDANSQKSVHTMEKAHNNCVNCIRFLDERLFATCSDDSTIKLWDMRNVEDPLKTLHGHSNWVKNIEFSPQDNLMVTSAFDGSIYAWDLASPTENSMLYDKIFLMNGLMRTKLTPDGTKMVISTTSGYMIVIHDLSLTHLANDFRAFKPVLYRLMQMTGQSFPAGTIFNYLFMPNRKRNRVEFIDDFTIDAEVISSLQIHPYGWNAVSRCLSGPETEEATNVHDIQKRDTCDYENCFAYMNETSDPDASNSDSEEGEEGGGGADGGGGDGGAEGAGPADGVQAIAAAVAAGGGGRNRPTDLWMGYISNYQYQSERNVQGSLMLDNFQLPAMGIINSGLIGTTNQYREYFRQHPEEKHKVVLNAPRLTHYKAEENVGRGYIKELCYSPDGRLICSPKNKGIRLLGFSEKCEELTYCVPDKPKELVSLVEMRNHHDDIVVSCKFSPTDYTLVSGSLDGQIMWYKPVL